MSGGVGTFLLSFGVLEGEWGVLGSGLLAFFEFTALMGLEFLMVE
jgi:hypothetical protein